MRLAGRLGGRVVVRPDPISHVTNELTFESTRESIVDLEVYPLVGSAREDTRSPVHLTGVLRILVAAAHGAAARAASSVGIG